MSLALHTAAADPVVCHCLQVRESEIADCVELLGAESVPAVKSHCGAGGGCTACHRRIRDVIKSRQGELVTA